MMVSAIDGRYDGTLLKQTSFEIMPDPYLEDGVNLRIHGTSNEFNSTYVPAGGVSSYVNLTWQHTAGTELNTTSSQLPFTTARGDYPYYWDFCYFTVSFTWMYDRLPTDAMFYLSCGVKTTGDFNTTEGNLMFNVHTWLIDSSDNWESLYTPEAPYSTANHLYSYDLNYFDLSAWRGMVEDELGNQEDPEDVMRVGVGLAPSDNFHEYGNTHPWETYNGSVSVSVSRVSLEIQMDTENEVPVIDPLTVVLPIVLLVGVLFVSVIWWNKQSK